MFNLTSYGVIFVAYGRPAIEQFRIARKNLDRVHPKWPVAVVCEEPVPRRRGMGPYESIVYHSDHVGARDAKLMVDVLAPWDYVLYMDADTRVRYDISPIWYILEDGWDIVAVPTGQVTRLGFAQHIWRSKEGTFLPGLEERNYTVEACGGWPVAGIQGGVIGFHKTEPVHRFFHEWRTEWEKYRDQDQPAASRALMKAPVRWFPLGQGFNGGGLVGHYHSHARRPGMKGSIHTERPSFL